MMDEQDNNETNTLLPFNGIDVEDVCTKKTVVKKEEPDLLTKYRKNNQTKVVNLKNVDITEWLKDPKNVYIGHSINPLDGHNVERSRQWALPSHIKGTRTAIDDAYEDWLLKTMASNPNMYGDIKNLKNKTLGCWCHPKLCHGDVIVEILDWA